MQPSKKSVHLIGIYEIVQYFRDADLSEEFCNPLPATQPLLFSDVAPVALLMPLSVSDVCVVRWEGGGEEKGPSLLGQRAMPFPSRLSSLISDATVDYALQFHSKPLCLILILTRYCLTILLTSLLHSFTTKMSPFPSLFPFEYATS